MLRPSYSDLLDVITRDAEDETIGSRYTIVIAAAKRARDIIDGKPILTDVEIDKPVSIAANEIAEDLITYRETID